LRSTQHTLGQFRGSFVYSELEIYIIPKLNGIQTHASTIVVSRGYHMRISTGLASRNEWKQANV